MNKEYHEKQYVPAQGNNEYMQCLCKYLRQYDIDFLYENFWLSATTTVIADGSGYKASAFDLDLALNSEDGCYKRTLVPCRNDCKLNKKRAIKCGLHRFFEFLTSDRIIYFSSLWSHFLTFYFSSFDSTGTARLNAVLDTQKEILRFSTVRHVIHITHYTEQGTQSRPKQALEKPIRKVRR